MDLGEHVSSSSTSFSSFFGESGSSNLFEILKIMKSGLHSGRKGKKDKLLGEYEETKSIFGRYTNAELLGQLKRLAQDPCAEFSRDKILPLWNQSLSIRRVMALCDTALPRRKLKLEHFCKDKLRASHANVDENTRKGTFSYVSLLNSFDNAEGVDQKITAGSCDSTSLPTFEDKFQDEIFLDDAIYWKSTAKNLMALVDSDESKNGSAQLSSENLSCLALDSLGGTQTLNSRSLSRGKKHHLQSARLSTKILNFIGDISRRSVIPIGTRFQADVPEWSGASLNKAGCIGEDSHCDDSRWLGTKIWPIPRRMATTTRVVGKGRSDSCSCTSPGSTECIRRHILEERLILQWDLGPAFFTWKFDEMGEQAVIKSWATKEQKTFEALLKDPHASGKNFLKHALVSLPRKSSKAIVSYYFNVFVPQWISQQTRSGHKVVDSDEEADDSSYMMKYGKRPRERGMPTASRGCKTRYLRRPS